MDHISPAPRSVNFIIEDREQSAYRLEMIPCAQCKVAPATKTLKVCTRHKPHVYSVCIRCLDVIGIKLLNNMIMR